MRRERIARWINLVLPGVGQLVKERPLRGILFLVVFSYVGTQVLLGSGLMRDPGSLGSGINWLKLVPMLVVFLGFYAWAILDVFRAHR
jgi:hypothetical protein